MIAPGGTFVVRRTRCSHEARESTDQTKNWRTFGLRVSLKML
jgi:hypothetical protein